MYLLKMQPAGMPVNVLFYPSLEETFIHSVADSWGAMKPNLVEVLEPDFSDPTIAIGYEERQELQDLPVSRSAEFAYLQVYQGQEERAAERLTVEVTLKMLEQLSGKMNLFHAAALGHKASQKGMILIGPSGRGKTTASRFLGQHFLYLSDETAVIDSQFRMHPYPKPLSIIVDRDRPKQQINPQDEGINALAPDYSEIELEQMILLDRRPDIEEPYLTRVPLAEALLSMVSETSGLEVSQVGLEKLNKLVNHCGGVLRMSYSEISDTLSLFTSLFEGDMSLPDDDTWHPETIELVEGHTGGERVEENQVARAENTSLLLVGERALMVSQRKLLEPSPLSIDIWLRLAEPRDKDMLREELMAEYGEIPQEDYLAFMNDLKQAGILQ